MRHGVVLIWGGLAMAAVLAAPPDAAIYGWWHAKLNFGNVAVRVALQVVQRPDGTLAAGLDSPDTGVQGLKLPDFKADARAVSFTVPGLPDKFHGELSADGKTIAGKIALGPDQVDAVFTKADGPISVERPQDPKPPFPYSVESVSIDNPEAPGVTLAGTLTLPPGAGPFAAAVMATGSGPQDRNEALMGHRPFLVIADYLTRQGIAVLRCDDRGVAQSKGNFATATTQDFAKDVAACARWLRHHAGIDPKRVGVIGHSEGGLIGPLVAVQDPDTAFVVMLAGPAVSGKDILIKQMVLLAAAQGLSPERLAASEKAERALLDAIGPDDTPEQVAPKLRPLVHTLAAAQGQELGDKQLDATVAGLANPWMLGFLRYDPAPTLRQLRVPVLALNGSLDLQVDAAQNLPPLVAALEAAGNRDYTVIKLPGLNHLFQPAKTGLVTEYPTISTTVSPVALEALGQWLVSRFGPGH